MNPTFVLVLLLLAVPLQLFFNHYLEQSYSADAASGSGAMSGLNEARVSALESLSTTIRSLKHQFRATFRHFSSWKNVMELFVIPRKKVKKTKAVHVSTFKTQDGNKITITTKSSSSAQSPSRQSSSQTNGKSNTLSQSKMTKDAPTSQAKEVEEYMMKEVYFAQSKTPRTTRPSNVQYSIGQVVKHKMDGYHGVIIGWDPVAKAPDWWLKKFYSKDRQNVIHTPHYHILVDAHYVSGTPYHYIPTDDLMPTNTQVTAPELDNFFEGYKDGKYIPRPWLKDTYPHG